MSESQVSDNVPLVLAAPETPFWGFGEIFVVFALALVALAGSGSVAIAVLGEQRARLGHWAVLEQMLAYLIVFAGMKALFFWQQKPLMRSLAFVRSPIRLRTAVYTGFLLVGLSVAIAILARTPDVQTPFQEMLGESTLSRVTIALFGVTLGPLVEELLFRGFLQPVLVHMAGVFPGILITSLLFGILHLAQNGNLWQSGLVITMAGFGFGVVRHLTGSTRASTVTHIAYNSLPFLMTVFPPSSK